MLADARAIVESVLTGPWTPRSPAASGRRAEITARLRREYGELDIAAPPSVNSATNEGAHTMTTPETTPGIPPDLMAQLQAAAERAARGVRDPEAMRRACQSLNQLREEIRQKQGVLDVVVPALRALRG